MFRIFISRKVAVFALVDAALIAGGVYASLRIRYLSEPDALAYFTALPDFIYRVVVVIAVFQLSGYYQGLYELNKRSSVSDHFFRVCMALGSGCIVLACIYYAAPDLRLGRTSFAVSVAILVSSLTFFRWLIDLLWSTAIPKENVLVVGDQDLAQEIARAAESRSDLNLRLAGFVSADGEDSPRVPAEQILGTTKDLEELAQRYQAQRVVIALEDRRGVLPVSQLLRLRTRGIQVEEAHSTIAFLSGRIPVHAMPTSWLVFSEGFRRDRLTMAFKRALDLVVSAVGLVFALPVMALVAIVVRLDSPGRAIYSQERVGLRGSAFRLIKFRTMKRDAEADGVPRWSAENDPRVTRIGKYLRKYRLDELPQLVNILRGEMSFVGPRPERPEFVASLQETIPFYNERHSMRPGLTGWAQVCYPYGSSHDDAVRKLEYELFYLKNASVLFDLAILFQTVRIVLLGRGR